MWRRDKDAAGLNDSS